jgi:hypothetical protein
MSYFENNKLIPLHKMASNETQSFIQIMHSERQKLANDEKYIQLLESYLSKHYFENYIRSREGLWPYKTESQYATEEIVKNYDKIIKEITKYRGKKVSKKNMRFYNDIDKEHKLLEKNAGEASWSTAVRIACRKNRRVFKTEYPNFIKWKNSKSKK